MIRDRLLLLAGVTLSLICTLVLLLWGNTLVRVLEVMAMPVPQADEGAPQLIAMQQDLSLTSLASLGLGAGLCLIAYATSLSAWRRRLPLLAKSGAVLGGALLVVSGMLLLVAFREIYTAFQLLALAGVAPQAEHVSAVIAAGIHRSSPSFFTLFSAQLVLAISLGSLFWSDVCEEQRSGLDFPVLMLSLLSAAACGVLLAFSALSAQGALEMMAGGARAPVKPSELAGALSAAITYATLAGAALFVYGAATALRGLLFRGER